MNQHTPQDKHELETMDWNIIGIITYRGCEIRKIIGGYCVFTRNIASTPEQVDSIIDEALGVIDKSIKQ